MRTRAVDAGLSRRKKIFFVLITLLLMAALLVSAAEVIVRLKGVEAWRTPELAIEVEPGGKFFRKHPTLGYTHLPGEFIVTLDEVYSFKVTHLPDTLRVTKPLAAYAENRQEPAIWIFGGSFTHGWSIHDEETYPWLIQEDFPGFEVVNFGVSGYGTIHSLVQFREALEGREAPVVAVIAYASFHDERNVFSRKRRKEIAPWNKLGPLVQPYARIDGEGDLRYSLADVGYRELPFMRYSALVHYLEQVYNQYEDRGYDSDRVSQALMTEMHRLAQQRDVPLVVAGIAGSTAAMLEHARRLGAPAIDISVEPERAENNNLPYDPHPSAVANRRYADRLGAFLRREVLR